MVSNVVFKMADRYQSIVRYDMLSRHNLSIQEKMDSTKVGERGLLYRELRIFGDSASFSSTSKHGTA